MLEGAKVLVTGGAGFIGSNLVDSIIDKCAEVRVLDNFSAGNKSNIEHLTGRGNFRLIRGDILNFRTLADAMKGIDVVFHLAAFMETSSNAVNAPIEDLRANAEGTLKVLMQAYKEGVKKFVYASSAAVYGQAKNLPQDEEHPLNPNWPYGVSKLAGEKYVRDFYELYGLETVSLRIAICYGPREWYGRIMTIFLKSALANQPLVIFGDGEQTRDFVHVNDVVDLFVSVAETDNLGGEVFNVGSGKETTINALADTILEITSNKNNVEKVYADPELGTGGRFLAELKHLTLDMKKAREKLGFKARISLESGIRQQLEWLHEYPDRWR